MPVDFFTHYAADFELSRRALGAGFDLFVDWASPLPVREAETAGLPREPMTLSQLGSFLDYLVTGHNLYACLTIPYLQNYLRIKSSRTYCD